MVRVPMTSSWPSRLLRVRSDRIGALIGVYWGLFLAASGGWALLSHLLTRGETWHGAEELSWRGILFFGGLAPWGLSTFAVARWRPRWLVALAAMSLGVVALLSWRYPFEAPLYRKLAGLIVLGMPYLIVLGRAKMPPEAQA